MDFSIQVWLDNFWLLTSWHTYPHHYHPLPPAEKKKIKASWVFENLSSLEYEAE